MIRPPDTKNVVRIIYRYKINGKIKDYYLEGDDVREFFDQLGGASVLSFTHGMSFKPVHWKTKAQRRS